MNTDININAICYIFIYLYQHNATRTYTKMSQNYNQYPILSGDRAHDIRVKMSDHNDWEPAPPEWVAAYINYKSRPAYGGGPEIPVNYNNQLSVFRVNNDCYMPTRIQRTDTWDTYPIMDCADVKVFLQDAEPANWYPARNYQMWAFRDFVNDPARPVRKFYASKYSSCLFFQRGALLQHQQQSVVDIDIDGLSPNIIFSISRNDNNSVYYERNDATGTRVRICDHEGARAGFRGFYTRMTMDPGIIVSLPPSPPSPPSPQHYSNHNNPLPLLLPLPHSITTSQTNDEDEQCIMCYENRKNLEFAPCAHFIVCDACYVKFEKPRECPMCKCDILSLIDRT